MSKVKPQYLVSTDSIGFFGKPKQFINIWKEFFDNKTLDGVEVIALKPLNQLDKLIAAFKKNNIPVLSFHGKTGGEKILDFKSRVIMTFLNNFIEESANLLAHFPEVEYLSHTPYFENKNVYETVIKNQPKKIWIENHMQGRMGIEDAIKQINIYRKNNINACGMLDVYHYVAHSEKILSKNWSNTVGELKSYFLMKDNHGKPFFCGIHFPIGTRLSDSLPLEDMTDEMLKLFAQKIIPQVERVVFENQQKNFGLFFSPKRMIAYQKTRNKKVFKRLKKVGIIY
jgi:hypothetical protein